MEDLALQNASARLAAAQERFSSIVEEIQGLNEVKSRVGDEIAALRAFIDTWYEMAGIPNPMVTEQDEYVSAQRTRPRNPDRELVADYCVEIVRTMGHPLSRRDLFQALVDRGIVIEGKDPEMVLSTMLWRSKDKIVRLPGHGYWPADMIYNPAGYIVFDNVTKDVLGVAANEPEDGIETDE